MDHSTVVTMATRTITSHPRCECQFRKLPCGLLSILPVIVLLARHPHPHPRPRPHPRPHPHPLLDVLPPLPHLPRRPLLSHTKTPTPLFPLSSTAGRRPLSLTHRVDVMDVRESLRSHSFLSKTRPFTLTDSTSRTSHRVCYTFTTVFDLLV